MTEAPAQASVPEDEILGELASDLDALSNLQRLRLVHLLTRPRYAEELSEALGMSRQSALKHIEKLAERGFVRALHGRRATGPVIEYLVVPTRLVAVAVALGNLGRLEPEGGPAVRVDEKTVSFGFDGAQEGGAPLASPTAHLLAVAGPLAGSRFPLDGDRTRWTIGRDADRDLRLASDPFVSGRHAEIQRERMGPVLVDVFSANGTLLNCAKIPRGGRVTLRAGDAIGIGHTVLVFHPQ